MARVLAVATNVSFQLVCRAWLHVIAVDLLFMHKTTTSFLWREETVSVLSVIWMKVKGLQSVDEVEVDKDVVNDPLLDKVVVGEGEVKERWMDGF